MVDLFCLLAAPGQIRSEIGHEITEQRGFVISNTCMIQGKVEGALCVKAGGLFLLYNNISYDILCVCVWDCDVWLIYN